MYMARLESPGQPALNLYKHFYTRYYLNLDDAGHAYVFVGTSRRPKGKQHLLDAGLYEPLPDLLTALERLDLGFLDENAWMTDHDRESLARLIDRKQRECRRAATSVAASRVTAERGSKGVYAVRRRT
jgi:hypothetical protein